jgi:hypothetical protein
MPRFRSTSAIVAGLMPVVAFGTVANGYTGGPPGSISPTTSMAAFGKHYGQAGNFSGYSVIALTGRRSAWVFGGTNPGGPSSPVVAQWNGTTLRTAALPAGLTGFISAASASSASNAWAVSGYGGYAVRWSGGRWRVARRWQHGQITGVLAVSPHEVWVFGTALDGTRGVGTWLFNGNSWKAISGPAGGIYQAAAWHRDIWAIAATERGDRIQRYNGSRWRRVRTGRVLNGVDLTSIAAVSGSDIWVLGNLAGHAGPGRVVLAHWDGSRWQRIVTGERAWAGQLASGSHGGALATATPATSAAVGLILRVSAVGRVAATTVDTGMGSGVSDVALAPGAQSVWATGGALTDVGANAAVWVIPLARAYPG